MEAMVSRWVDITRAGWWSYIHTEMVSVWTDEGTFSMPYKIFRSLFGIELDMLEERKVVTLPSTKS